MREVVVGCDSAALTLKSIVIAQLENLGVRVENMGCDSAADPVYYSVVAERVCRRMIDGGFQKRGILICGTGIGMCMTANKFPGVRAAVCHDGYSAERAVLSNNANVLCLGERVIGSELAKKIVSEWIALEFRDGASSPKVADIARIERETFGMG